VDDADNNTHQQCSCGVGIGCLTSWWHGTGLSFFVPQRLRLPVIEKAMKLYCHD
jgi:hypothetical protein